MAQDIPCHDCKQGGRRPTVAGFIVAPEHMGVHGRADEAVRFQCDNPAGMDADGDEEVAGSLKGARQNQPGQEQVHRVSWPVRVMGKIMDELRECCEAGAPGDFRYVGPLINEMNTGKKQGAGNSGPTPIHITAQQAKEHAAKQGFFEHTYGNGGAQCI